MSAKEQNYTKLLLGENSYPIIVEDIVKKIQNAKANTLEGEEFLKQMYKTLNESKTPILDIKPFVTNGEKVASEDLSLKEVLDFCKKSITKGDLNFLINLAKEEHFKEMKKLNHPSPEATIKSFEEQFNEPAGVIEQGIKAGIFDSMKSSLLGIIKNDLNIKPVQQKQAVVEGDKNMEDNIQKTLEKIKPLNENQPFFNGSLIKYSPVGIQLEDTKNNRTVLLLENSSLVFDIAQNKFENLNESEISIPEEHKKLLTAINSCAYNPETETFGLNENWDFSIELKNNGKIMIGTKEIKKEHVPVLLFESIKLYETQPNKVENFNKIKYLRDADQFVTLCENSDLLIKFDQLTTIKNLNEGSYILLDNESVYDIAQPEILSSSKNKTKKLFESYSVMIQEINGLLSQNIGELFERQMFNETQLLNTRNEKIVELNEDRKLIEKSLKEIERMKPIAEEGSIAREKLVKQETSLNESLNKNMEELNFFVNNYKLY